LDTSPFNLLVYVIVLVILVVLALELLSRV